MISANGYNPLRWDCQKRGCFNLKRRPKIEIFAECFPGRINFGDVDGIVEINGNALLLTRNKNGRLGERLDVDRDAEVLEAFDEASGLRLLGSLVEVAGAEILVFGAVLEHVVGSRQHRGRDRADGFLGAATGAQAVELGLQIAPRLADGGPSALHQSRLQPGSALAQAGRAPFSGALIIAGAQTGPREEGPAVGKRLMSMPISETMIRLASAPTPGIAVRFCAAARKGARLASTSWSI